MKTVTVNPKRKHFVSLRGAASFAAGQGEGVVYVPPGLDVFVCPQRNTKKMTAAALTLKKTMPPAAKPGEKTARDYLDELRAE